MDISGVFLTCRISAFIMSPGVSHLGADSSGMLGEMPGMGGA